MTKTYSTCSSWSGRLLKHTRKTDKSDRPPITIQKKSRRALHVYGICTWRDEPYKTPFGIVSCVSRRHTCYSWIISEWLWKIDFFSKVHWLILIKKKTWPSENALINPCVFHRCGPLTGRQLFYATLPRHHSRANLFSSLVEFPSMICDPDDGCQWRVYF